MLLLGIILKINCFRLKKTVADNIHFEVDVYHRLNENIEISCFGSVLYEREYNNTFKIDFTLLKHFSLYFKEKISSLFSEHSQSNLSFLNIDSDSNYNFAQYSKIFNKIDTFLKDEKKGYLLKLKDGVISITSREMDVLSCLSRGKTTKEMARILQLSPRTVETYYENLKSKMGAFSKSQIIDIFFENVVKNQISKR